MLILLLTLVACIPPAVAGMATAPSEPISFRRDPFAGYSFVARVASQSAHGAHASSPGRALEIAHRSWGGSVATAGWHIERVELLYLPGHTTLPLESAGRLAVPSSGAAFDPPRPLIWQVLGRSGEFGPTRTVGLIDFMSGQIVWSSPWMSTQGDS